MNQPGLRRMALGALVPVTLAGMGACTTAGGAPGAPATPPSGVVQISRTTNGIAHIVAADQEMLAYGVAYAHAQDNVCQTAEALVLVTSCHRAHDAQAAPLRTVAAQVAIAFGRSPPLP